MIVKFKIDMSRSEARTQEFCSFIYQMGVSKPFLFNARRRNVPLYIYCTPEQFVIFIIRRNQLNFTNSIKNLELEVVKESPEHIIKCDITNKGYC